MGQLGKELIGQARTEIISKLRRAFADEWHAHYNFQLVAATLSGYRAPAVVTLLDEMSSFSFKRARRWARRLCELGDHPPERLADVVQAASDKPFKLPKDASDVDGALRAVLDAQRTSLRSYNAIWNLAQTADPVTADIALRCLSDAVHDEETLERLLGQTAPEMTGKSALSSPASQ